MTVQEVMSEGAQRRAALVSGADILGMSPAHACGAGASGTSTFGYLGLVDKRHQPAVGAARAGRRGRAVLRLYRERYAGFNVRHFHQIVRREHGVTVSYSFVKQTPTDRRLGEETAGAGRHRRRREPRACFGELLHLDGSVHRLVRAGARSSARCLIAVPDDATNRVLQRRSLRSESTHAVMTTLAVVLRRRGLPMALYTDRARWAFYTPTAKARSTSTRLTQVGPRAPALGHRAHSLLFAASPRAQRAAQSHLPRSARQ